MNKRIRSILCLVLALCVAFAFAACGSKDAKEDAETAAGEAGQAATEAVEDAAAVNYDTAYWGQSEDGAEVFFLIDSKTVTPAFCPRLTRASQCSMLARAETTATVLIR